MWHWHCVPSVLLYEFMAFFSQPWHPSARVWMKQIISWNLKLAMLTTHVRLQQPCILNVVAETCHLENPARDEKTSNACRATGQLWCNLSWDKLVLGNLAMLKQSVYVTLKPQTLIYVERGSVEHAKLFQDKIRNCYGTNAGACHYINPEKNSKGTGTFYISESLCLSMPLLPGRKSFSNLKTWWGTWQGLFMTLETGRLSWFGQAMKIYPSDFRFNGYFISPFTKHHSRKRWLAQRCSLWKHSILAEFLLHDCECWKNIKVFPQKNTWKKNIISILPPQNINFEKNDFWQKYRNLNFEISKSQFCVLNVKISKNKKMIPKYRNLNFFECAQF